MNSDSMLRKCLIAAGVVFILPLLVFADLGIGEQLVSIGPRATYSTPKDADSGQWFTGAQVRLHLSPSSALEGSIDYRRNTFANLTIIKSYPVQVSLMTYLSPGSIVSPFLLGGVGMYYTQVEGPFGFSSTSSRLGLHAGAGMKLVISEGLSIDGSYRYVWLESVGSRDADALDKNYEDSGSMVTVAIILFF